MYNTIHIFKYGECQVISNEENTKTSTENCPSAQAVVDMLFAKKPQDNNASNEYHVVTIFNDISARYSSLEGFFDVEFSEIDSTLVEQLAIEIRNA